ncbi:unnamed protein product [Boreogadus saida]
MRGPVPAWPCVALSLRGLSRVALSCVARPCVACPEWPCSWPCPCVALSLRGPVLSGLPMRGPRAMYRLGPSMRGCPCVSLSLRCPCVSGGGGSVKTDDGDSDLRVALSVLSAQRSGPIAGVRTGSCWPWRPRTGGWSTRSFRSKRPGPMETKNLEIKNPQFI